MRNPLVVIWGISRLRPSVDLLAERYTASCEIKTARSGEKEGAAPEPGMNAAFKPWVWRALGGGGGGVKAAAQAAAAE